MTVDPHSEQHTILSVSTRWKIFSYFGALMTLMAFCDPNGGLLDPPISFVLKNSLHLEAQDLSRFKLISAIPLYFSFAFGLVRDNWSPFGASDRGLLMLFGFLSAAMCIAFAFMPITIGTLLAAGLLLTSSSLFIASAQSGLAATLGHQHAMSGQISAAWNVFTALPAVAAYLVEGRLSQMLEGDGPEATCRVFFLIGAASSLLLGCFAFFKPASVYANVRREHGPGSHPFADLMRLARHRGVYPALLIWLLWNFSPGSITPLQYHLQNTLGAADWEWGVWNAIYTASFIPTFVAFGVLCRWFPLKTLLFWGTLVAIPQLIPLLFIGSVNAALIAAAPIGLMGGVATGAYLDLIIRSCPPGLEGTTLMFAGALYFISTRSGDMLGTYLYDNLGGFTPCVLAGAAVYAMILPSLRMVPENLVSTVEPR